LIRRPDCAIFTVPPLPISMSGTPSIHPKETLFSTCRHLDGERLRRGRAVLTPVELLVSGWSGVHRVSLRIPLKGIERVERSSDGEEPTLVVETRKGARHSVDVSAPGLWRRSMLDRLLPEHSTAAPEPPTVDRTSQPFALRVAYVAESRRPLPQESRTRWFTLAELTAA
jgi:hypothetical protein